MLHTFPQKGIDLRQLKNVCFSNCCFRSLALLRSELPFIAILPWSFTDFTGSLSPNGLLHFVRASLPLRQIPLFLERFQIKFVKFATHSFPESMRL